MVLEKGISFIFLKDFSAILEKEGKRNNKSIQTVEMMADNDSLSGLSRASIAEVSGRLSSSLSKKTSQLSSRGTKDSLGMDMSDPEKRLVDLLDIGQTTQSKAKEMRRVNGYLRIFSAVVDFINGSSRKLKEISTPITTAPSSTRKGSAWDGEV